MKSSGLFNEYQDLVAGDRDRRSAAGPALDLDEPEPARVRHAALDIVPQLLELPVGRVEPETPLGLHDDAARAADSRVSTAVLGPADSRPPISSMSRLDTTSNPPRTTGGSGEIRASSLSFVRMSKGRWKRR